MAFQRNTPVYWTLQNRRPVKPQPVSVTSRDDLYATPIKRSERVARAQQQQQQQPQVVNSATSCGSLATTSTYSPLQQRNRNSFLTSTPIRGQLDSQLPADNIPAKQPTSRIQNWDDNSPERLNTCADRIGQSKTSLMDFKKLLLAKSAKTSTVPKKISAVELLKKNNANQSPIKTGSNNSEINSATTASQLNSSMKLLELSGSPKTFANRRMLRQGQFGSPSKTFVPKIKTSPATWRSNSVQRTDIMSTTIPEARDSEEDHSNNSSQNSSTTSSKQASKPQGENLPPTESLVDTESLNLKRNIFLQTEENNFMRGELRSSFGRGNNSNKTAAISPLRSPQINTSTATTSMMASPSASSTSSTSSSSTKTSNPKTATATTASNITNMPALETAL